MADFDLMNPLEPLQSMGQIKVEVLGFHQVFYYV